MNAVPNTPIATREMKNAYQSQAPGSPLVPWSLAYTPPWYNLIAFQMSQAVLAAKALKMAIKFVFFTSKTLGGQLRERLSKA